MFKTNLMQPNFFLQKLDIVMNPKADAWTNVNEHLCYLDGFLFEIVGPMDAFLFYINKLAGCPLKDWQVNEKALLREFSKKDFKSLFTVIKKLNDLRENKESWFHILNEYRNITTHRRLLPRFFEIQFKFGQRRDDGSFDMSLNTAITFRPGDMFNIPDMTSENGDVMPRKLLMYRNPAEYEKELGENEKPNSDTIDALDYCRKTFEQMSKLLADMYLTTLEVKDNVKN